MWRLQLGEVLVVQSSNVNFTTPSHGILCSVATTFLQSFKRTSHLFNRAFSGVTIAQIKELRNITGSPIDECKKALEAEGGDINKARDYLKKRGLAQANKRSGKAASEGIIGVKFTPSFDTAIVAEINCETDFVAKSDAFLRYVNVLMSSIANQTNVPELGFKTYESGVEEEINNFLKKPLSNKFHFEGHECSDLFEAKQLAISKLQENIKVRKLFTFKSASPKGVVGSYIHMTLAEGVGKSCSLVDLESDASNKAALREIANNLSMQVLGNRPEYLTREDIPANILNEEIEKVKESLQEVMKNKPPKVVENMVEGKLKKFLGESVLYFQEYMVENDSGKTVQEYLKDQEKVLGGSIKVNKYQIVELDQE